ncbi:MAG: hypothetical protein KAG66_21345, partial [Methylococcales bacterium]|nr:hypothetical protein [Methylococcales bacterium]
DVMFLKIPYDPDRSVLLSWAGHLVIPKADVFWRVDDSTMALRLIGVPHIEQLMGMFSAINTDHLGLVTPSPKKQCLRDFYFSNPVLKTLLRSVNSFLITVNTPLLAVKTRPIRSHRYPGLLILGRKPELPLVSSPGRLCEYWRQPVDGYWHLNAKDTHYRDYALDGAALEANTVAKDRLKAGLVHHRAKLGFMEFLGYS